MSSQRLRRDLLAVRAVGLRCKGGPCCRRQAGPVKLRRNLGWVMIWRSCVGECQEHWLCELKKSSDRKVGHADLAPRVRDERSWKFLGWQRVSTRWPSVTPLTWECRPWMGKHHPPASRGALKQPQRSLPPAHKGAKIFLIFFFFLTRLSLIHSFSFLHALFPISSTAFVLVLCC